MSLEFYYYIRYENSPLWSFAIHNGHHIDQQLLPYMKLEDAERLREEDPFTAEIADIGVNQLILGTSRFQLDINRTMEDSVYLRPDQAWGLNVWDKTLPTPLLSSLYQQHTELYSLIEQQLEYTLKKFGYFEVLDIHSYNACRTHPADRIDEQHHPQINLGTYYNHPKWKNHALEILDFSKSQNLYGDPIDIRENIKFKGGNLAQHLINCFGDQGCIWSIEFRKDFMDEWTGTAYPERIKACRQLLCRIADHLKTSPNYAKQQ